MRGAAVAALLALTGPALGQDFSADSQAKEWGLYGESKARFAATVVDPLCELTGDCPENCGDGRRQLALIREADGVMVLPLKNTQPAFTGAVSELLPYCGQAVEVDGLLITDEEIGARNVYQIQFIRAEGAGDWVTANRWTRDWAEANPDVGGQGPWFRRDPRIQAEIDKEGWLGLGPDTDKAFLDEWFN